MSTHLPSATITPLVYDPSYEALEEDEAQTTQDLIDSLQGIAETVAGNAGVAFRSVHAKAHGILQGKLEVLPLEGIYVQGLFAQAGIYDATIRLSTTPGDLLPEAVSTPRGLAMKLMPVSGARNDPQDGLSEQDFIFVNLPVFSAGTAKQFLQGVKLFAATTDKAPKAKAWFATVLRGVENVIEKVGIESTSLKAFGGHPATHPLAETYFTQVPLRFGPFMAKLALFPVDPAMLALEETRLDLSEEDALRNAVQDFCSAHHTEWELRVQLCTDIERMPIEDASVEWPEELSPFVTIARLHTPVQDSWNAQVASRDNTLRFNPWNGLAAHRPLGSIMRVRRLVYAMSAQFRQRFNANAADKPNTADEHSGTK